MTFASRPSSIKPPPFHLPVPGPLPEYPGITPEQAVETLLSPDSARRHIERASIEDLRPVIALFLERCPDPAEYNWLVFRNVVIRYADLRDFVIPHELHFAYAYFLNELDISNSTINSLSIAGHYAKGNLGLVNVKSCREVSIQNCQIDGIYCYDAEIERLHLFGVRLGNSLTVADMYPACLLGARAVAMMGIRNAPLVSLTDRLSQPYGSSDFGCVLGSVPCSHLNRELG